MSDLYEDFEESDELDGNDEEIDALGSILSWDDEDDAAVSAQVAATASVLNDREAAMPELPPLPSFGNFPEHISMAGMLSNQTPQSSQISQQQHYQMMIQQLQAFHNAASSTTQVQAASGQQTGQQMNQQQENKQQQQFLSIVPSAGQTQQAQATQTYFPSEVAQQFMSTKGQGLQLQSLQQTGQAQHQQTATPAQQLKPQVQPQQQPSSQAQQMNQASQSQPQRVIPQQQPQQQSVAPNGQFTAPGFAGINFYQQQLFQPQAEQLSLQQAMPVIQGHPQQTQDANAFLRQMQMQYQQMVPRSLQPALVVQQQQSLIAQPLGSMSAPLPQLVTSSSRKVSGKRKATKPPAAAKPTVVSCSDTDMESKAGTKKGKKQAAPKKPRIEEEEDDDDDPNLSPEERTRANRDRNREHARNTRLRKKAYLEKLKSTVDELCRERDTLVSERAGAATLLVEMHNTRTEVLMSFFALRSSFEKQRELWASILDESCFACVMPVTPYRSFPASEVQVSKCQRTVLGIDGMMADTASLHVLLNTLVDRSRYPTAKIEFRYTLVTEDAVVAGNQMMARWVMSTLNATQFGARMEVSKQGMLCAKFNSAHKIIGLELMFDVMAFMLQLKQAAGSSEFTVVPNTVQTCQRPFKMPMVMTLAERPYAIVQVNKLWEEMTGYKAEDVVGKASCRILQGQETDQKAVEQLMSEVRFKRPGSATFVNYTRGGKRFHNFITLYPLSADSKITHYVALTSHYDLLDSRSFSDSSEVVHNAAHAPPPALGAPLRPAEGVLKPSPQVLLPSQAQAQLPGMMMPGASVLPPGMAALPPGNDSAARQVLYFQAQQGILPRPPTSQLPLLQPLTANAPTSIAPRTTETQETPAKKGI